MKAEVGRPILINCLVCRCPFQSVNGHHHERRINVLSILSTYNHRVCALYNFINLMRLASSRILYHRLQKRNQKDQYTFFICPKYIHFDIL
jgi:hypothetical protein